MLLNGPVVALHVRSPGFHSQQGKKKKKKKKKIKDPGKQSLKKGKKA
jgi:hypothetical protein